MFQFKTTWMVMAGLVFVIVASNGEVAAQCSGRGGMPMASNGTTAPNLALRQASTASFANPQANLLALQYQQRMMAAQQQRSALLLQNARQQQQAAADRQAHLQRIRMANAEAERARRAERIAARLRDQGRIDEAYAFVSTTARSPQR